MFNIEFDLKDFELYANELTGIDIDTQKIVQWYINQVYADLSKQHGRGYQYETPPASARTVLRKRSGDLLRELRDSKYVEVSDGQAEAGFRIQAGSSLATHEGSEDDSPTVIRAKNGSYLTIPLRAALNSNGSPRRMTARSFGQLRKYYVVDQIRKAQGSHGSKSKIIPIESSKLQASGENIAKLEHSLILGKSVGRKVVPYFILAKKVSIPKRLFINQAMANREADLYDRIDKEIAKVLK